MISMNTQLALDLLTVVPKIMQTIRSEMRQSRGADLSIPQFRVLAHLRRKPGVSLSETAEYLGLTSPSIVSLVDALAAKNLVTRAQAADDRRKIALCLTQEGEEVFDAAFQAAQQKMAARLEHLSAHDLSMLLRSMELLGAEFVAAAPAKPAAALPGQGA
jgi:DNA-binding MarR family transcriptional regulator